MVLVQVPNSTGRLSVTLSHQGHHVTEAVHRLVLEAHVGPCPAGLEGCHDNGNHLDNWVNNLYWGSKSDNAKDSIRHGTNWNTRKTHCKRDHVLVLPNLRRSELAKGHRGCPACGRAWADVQRSAQRGIVADVGELANRHYRLIMGRVS